MHGTFRTLFTLGAACTVMSLGLTGCVPLTQANEAAVTPPPSESTQPPSESAEPEAPLAPLAWPDGTKLTFNERRLDEARVATKDKDFTEAFSTNDLKSSKTTFIPLGTEPSGTPVGLYGTRLSEEDFEESGNRIDPESTQIGRYVGKSFEPFTTSGALKKKYIPRGVSSISVTDTGIAWSENYSSDDGTPGWRVLGSLREPPMSGFWQHRRRWTARDLALMSSRSPPPLCGRPGLLELLRPHDDDGSMVHKYCPSISRIPPPCARNLDRTAPAANRMGRTCTSGEMGWPPWQKSRTTVTTETPRRSVPTFRETARNPASGKFGGRCLRRRRANAATRFRRASALGGLWQRLFPR